MKHALVTGGAGFIGSHLCEALLAEGYAVTAVDNLSTGRAENIAAIASHPQFHFVAGTVLDAKLIDRLVAKADMVFHLAASVGVKLVVSNLVDSIENNVKGTEAVLAAASRHGARVLLTSSSEVYGRHSERAFREDDDLRMGPPDKTRWSYACAKALDEYLAFAYYYERQLPSTVARLFNTVGERQTAAFGMVLPTLVAQALANQPLTIYGTGQQSRCFCHVSDVVRALIDLSEHPDSVGQVYNIGGTENITIDALADRIIALTGSRSTKQYLRYRDVYAVGFDDIERREPDISKLHELTGFTPKFSLHEIIRKVAADVQTQRQTTTPVNASSAIS